MKIFNLVMALSFIAGCAMMNKVIIPSIEDCSKILEQGGGAIINAIHDPIAEIGPIAIDTIASFECLEKDVKIHLAQERADEAEQARAILALKLVKARVQSGR